MDPYWRLTEGTQLFGRESWLDLQSHQGVMVNIDKKKLLPHQNLPKLAYSKLLQKGRDRNVCELLLIDEVLGGLYPDIPSAHFTSCFASPPPDHVIIIALCSIVL